MVITEKSTTEILKVLLKDLTKKNTVSSLSADIKIKRPGVWKALKRLELKKLVNLSSLGNGKTSAYEITLNWKNPVVEKTLSTILTEDALEQERWRDNFKKLEKHSFFIILFGSILHSPIEANDIDLLIIVKSKENFKEVDNIISEIQQTHSRKIHAIDITEEEFNMELKKENKAYLDALKKGTILFGQEKFIKFVEEKLK